MGEKNPVPGSLTEAEEKTWRRRYESFGRLYKGREDVIAERQNGEYVAREGAGLTFERFLDHVSMRKTYAVYNKDDGGRVRFGLFDVDVLRRERGWDAILPEMEEKRRETSRIMQTLAEMGLQRHNMLLEFPTVGFHLLIFFAEPVPAATLKTVMRFVLERSGLEQIPSYPKKTEQPHGDRVQLPLRINLNTKKKSNFIRDLDSFDPLTYDDEPDFSVLEEVVLIDAEWVPRMMGKYHLK